MREDPAVIASAFRGSLAALGREPAWYRFFDLSRRGLVLSFLAAGATLPAYLVVARASETERAIVMGEAVRAIPHLWVLGAALAYTLAFPFVAVVSTTLFGRTERYAGWVVARHWTVFFIAWAVAGLFGLYLAGALPYRIPNFIGLVAWFGVLAADIRLARKVGGLGLGAAVLVGSIVMSLAMSLALMVLLLYLGSAPT